jgi:hypothetical protein
VFGARIEVGTAWVVGKLDCYLGYNEERKAQVKGTRIFSGGKEVTPELER